MLSGTKSIKISTESQSLVDDNGKPLTIEVEIDVSVNADLQEAINFFGGEEKVSEILQTVISTRKGNLARPVLREATRPLDWASVALSTAESYTPGRRSGPPVIEASDIANAANSGDPEAIIRLLQSKGFAVAFNEG